MAAKVTVVGAPDRSLEHRLLAVGLETATLPLADLQALAHPASAAPDVVVLDLRSQGQIPRALGQIKRQHPDTGLVIVASTLDPALMLEAMRSGVTECVTDISLGELEAAVNRVLAERAAPVAGEVFVFVGAKGGVGTTTVAVNTATALSKFGSTLVIDLHLAGGDAALYLGADPHFSVIDAIENTHRLDVSYFRGLLARTKTGPDLLASTDRTVTLAVDPPRVRTLIDFASRHYRFTALDVPRSDPAVLDALEAATKIIVVANQELATVRGAGRLTAMLRQRYSADKVTLVLNRSDRHAEIGLDDLERAVGRPIAASFPSDYRLALDALNHGQPLVTESKAALAEAFRGFARTLAGVTQQLEPPATRGLLSRLAGRR